VSESADPAQRLQRLLGYLKQDPKNVPLIVETAELASKLGRGGEALEWLDTALLAHPGDQRLLSTKGNLLLALGRVKDAAALFEELIERYGSHPVLHFNLAQARLHEGRAEESLALLESVPEADRATLPQFDLCYGSTAYQLRRYDQALASVERFLAGNPGHPEACGLKAMLLYDNGREDEGIALAQILLRRNPEQWPAHLVLGSTALSTQNGAAAEAHFAKVVEQVPEAGRAWSGLGFAALIRQDLRGARERLEKAVLYMADHPGTWQGLAWTCILLGDLGRAREAIDRSMQVDRNFADNHGTLAVLEFMQGRRTEAELAVRKALRLNPAAPSALYARSLLQEAAGDSAAADATVERILSSMKGPQGAALLRQYQSARQAGRRGPPRPPSSKLH
jgi:tetratricopeptide (TPR) repeat protein